MCTACHYSCNACSGSLNTLCTACNVSDFRTLIGTQCLCNAGYIDTGVSICAACDYTCQACSGLANNQCTSCNATNLRTLSFGKCICNAGHNDNGVPACSICDATCLSCSGPSKTQCSSCNTSDLRVFNFSSNSCQCISSAYDGGQPTCIPCSSAMAGCISCTSNNVCTACNSSLNFVLTSSHNCTCIDGSPIPFNSTCLGSKAISNLSYPTTMSEMFSVGCYGALTIFAIGLVLNGPIGVELMHVLQTTYLSASLLSDETHPAVAIAGFVNGYTYRYSTAVASPYQLHAMAISQELLSNYNVMGGIQLLLAIIAVSGKFSACYNDHQPTRCRLFVDYLISNTLPYLVFFTTVSFSFACGFFFRCLPNISDSSIITGNILFMVLQLAISAYVGFVVYSGQLTVCWKILLKDEPAVTNRYPLVLMASRTLFGLLCGLMFDVAWRGFVVLSVQIMFLLYVAIRNPYLKRRMIARLLLNETVILFVLIAIIVIDYCKVV